ncbi:unnamed protein product, partial [Mesorhabditis spiculigera]
MLTRWPIRQCLAFRQLSGSTREKLDGVLKILNSRPTSDQLMYVSKNFLDVYQRGEPKEKLDLVLRLGKEAGINQNSLEGAISRFSKNNSLFLDVRSAATPAFHTLFQSIGNTEGGVRQICDIREFLLRQIRKADKADVAVLRRIEESCRELLTSWFCLSNLKLCRLTWESPGDIIQKVASYEAVHPVHGLLDIKRRVGPHRRCFYFQHEAMPREPLVIVHVALTDQIASNVQHITKEADLSYDESRDNTAIYYSSTSTQKGLSGVDLGNLLIKSVVAELSREDPHIKTHSTLSPIPGFRAWLLRALKEPQSFGDVLDEFCLQELKRLAQKDVSVEEGGRLLLNVLGSDRVEHQRIEVFKPLLMRLCATYLYKEKRNGYALNPVANFHLRNGAELYRINWAADTSARGLFNSFGIMVNYRYRLEDVNSNSASYVNSKTIAVDPQVLNLL